MSKPKKPAEDKSKAGAVTNSIADEILDEIYYVNEQADDLFNKDLALSVRKAKSALLTLIANRERKARLKEVYYLQTHCRPEMLDAVYIADRISALQAEDKES